MNIYPTELRQRVVDAVDSNVGTKKEIALIFSGTRNGVKSIAMPKVHRLYKMFAFSKIFLSL
jgi:hypothetical protein